MCTGTKRKILLPQGSHLGQSEARLSSHNQESMISTSQPFCSIRRSQQCFYFQVVEKTA